MTRTRPARRLLPAGALGLLPLFLVAPVLWAEPHAGSARFQEVLALLQDRFADAARAEPGRLLAAATDALIRALEDRHSRLLDADALRALRADVEGEFPGIGLVVAVREGRLVVVGTLPDSPAERAGLTTGDVLASAGGRPAAGLGLPDLARLLRGPEGSEVGLEVHRLGEPQPLAFALVRAPVHWSPVEPSLIADAVLMLKVRAFPRGTAKALRAAFEARRAGAESIVLDLRGNPGGLLDEAVETARLFLDRELVVAVQGRLGETTHYLGRGGPVIDLPTLVLVDGGSASSAEIVAAALQDNERALVVGRRTYGKGSVQGLIPLASGGALALTTAWYRTPAGRRLEGSGLEPDVDVGPGDDPLAIARELIEGARRLRTLDAAAASRPRARTHSLVD